MRLFLDASVLLAASGSATGASRHVSARDMHRKERAAYEGQS
jgi:uncharacterized DUF497 family protein